MLKLAINTLLISSLGLGVAAAGPNVRTIRKDVAIIGGGASGVYAAIKLKDHYGKSVLIVEREKRLVSPRQSLFKRNEPTLTATFTMPGWTCVPIRGPRHRRLF